VLLLLLTGLLDLSRAFYFDVGLHNAAREGARHGAWFDTGARQTLYLDDSDIKSTVDSVLIGSNLPTSTLVAGCPGSAPQHFPTTFSTQTMKPQLYICYDAQGSAYGAGSIYQGGPPPPRDTSMTGKDLEVVVTMTYGLVTGLMQGMFPNNFGMVAYQHMTIQGHP